MITDIAPINYTTCYALVAVNLPQKCHRSTKNIFILLCGGQNNYIDYQPFIK
jgi:hypothetical protein